MPPKNGLYLITKIHFSAALVIFLKAKNIIRGMIFMPACNN